MRIKIRIKTLDESGSRSSLYDEWGSPGKVKKILQTSNTWLFTSLNCTVENALQRLAKELLPVTGAATIVEYAIQCRIKAIVGAGKCPEQLLPAEVNLTRWIRIDAEPS
jgi:hypothetical protein